MLVDEALGLFEQWQREGRPGLAYKAGYTIAGEVTGLRGVIKTAQADEAERTRRTLEELCAAIGVERGQDDWPDFIARVRSAMERPEVEQTGEVPAEAPSEGASHMPDIHFHHPGAYQIQGEISIRLEDPSAAGRFDEVNAKLDQLLQKVMTAMSFIDDLRTEVERTTTLEQSAITLIQGLSQQIADAAGNEAAVRDLASQLSSQADALAAALPANTSDDTGSTTDQPTA